MTGSATLPDVPWREPTEEEDGADAVSMGCWIWTGIVDHRGIPRIRTKTSHTTAARYYWERHHGQAVPEGKELTPACGKQRCVNPHHKDVVDRTERSYRDNVVRLTTDLAWKANARAKEGWSKRQIAITFGVSERTAGRLADGSYCLLREKPSVRAKKAT